MRMEEEGKLPISNEGRVPCVDGEPAMDGGGGARLSSVGVGYGGLWLARACLYSSQRVKATIGSS